MPIDDILMDAEIHMEKAVEHVQHELRGIRTGRATPALVEHFKVEYYGSLTDLRSIASISVPEATQLLIKPFSPGDMHAIEKAINDSKIGLTPHSDGKADPPRAAASVAGAADATRRAVQAIRRDGQNRHPQRPPRCQQNLGNRTKKRRRHRRRSGQGGKSRSNELTKTYETKADELVEKKRAEVMQV